MTRWMARWMAKVFKATKTKVLKSILEKRFGGKLGTGGQYTACCNACGFASQDQSFKWKRDKRKCTVLVILIAIIGYYCSSMISTIRVLLVPLPRWIQTPHW
jgi:hypothetical protein